MSKELSYGNSAERQGGDALRRGQEGLRGRRTKAAIKRAFAELAKEKGFSRVSIQEIAKGAMINRATFYRHYKDKYHLAEEIFTSALRKMSNEVGPRFIRTEGDLLKAFSEKQAEIAWAGMFEHFASYAQIYEHLLSGRGSAWFLDRMRRHFALSYSRIHRMQESVLPLEIAYNFFASAAVGTIYFWLEDGMKHSPSQMAQWVRLLWYRGYVGVISGLPLGRKNKEG